MRIGVIAQEIEKAASYCVYKYECPELPGDIDKKEFFGVTDQPVTYILINAVKDLSNKLSLISERLDIAEKEIIILKSK